MNNGDAFATTGGRQAMKTHFQIIDEKFNRVISTFPRIESAYDYAATCRACGYTVRLDRLIPGTPRESRESLPILTRVDGEFGPKAIFA